MTEPDETVVIPPHSDEDYDPDHPDLQHEDGQEISEPDDLTSPEFEDGEAGAGGGQDEDG